MGTSFSILSGYFIQPKRHSYTKSFKAQVIQEYAQHSSSIASIGFSHNLSANPAKKAAGCAQSNTARKTVMVIYGLHAWMRFQRDLVPEDSAFRKTLDYSLKTWAALSRYLDDGAVPIDKNLLDNQIRPWDLGRKNWRR